MLTAPAAWLLAALALACVALGAWGYQHVRRWWLGRNLTRRFRRARHGEDNARVWLEEHGFTVLDGQVTQRAVLDIDGISTPFTVRADYLVERGGVRGIVEVKTGSVATPAAPATRRQILEYAWVYDVSEVYLFDADARILRRIGIPDRSHGVTSTPRSAKWPVMFAFAVGMVVGVAAAWYLMS